MKNQISTPMAIVIVLVVLLVVAAGGYMWMNSRDSGETGKHQPTSGPPPKPSTEPGKVGQATPLETK
ncbi:MAG: hypothetical protein HUU60_05100 [Armatimonadetes bacterium]|nr:hypothetical protein [Armatimonadota bacterium]